MGASPCRPERPVAWVAELLLIWGRGPAVRHSKSLRLRSGSILPSAAAYHHAFQRNSAVFRRGCLWEVGGLLATASLRPLRVHVTKSVGKPDAGNPHVRLCVLLKLACSVGKNPTGAKVRSPVAWIAGRKETEFL